MNKCRLCEKKIGRHLYTINKCDLSKCLSCGFVQVFPLPEREEIENIYSSSYFSHDKYDDDFSSKKELEFRLTLISLAGLTSESLVLDAGCATGDFVFQLTEYYPNTYGVDVSSDAISEGRIKYPEIIDKLSVSNLDFCNDYNNKYNLIMLWDVVEHVQDPKKIINDLKDSLLDGGYIVLSTPNIDSPIAKIMGSKWAFMTPPEHLGFFGKTTLSKLLSNNGFTVTKWTTKGKWVGLGFLFYKVNRIFPKLCPAWLVSVVKKSIFSRIPLYIPTQDIQYVVARKKSL
jgi:2-polyprenyl-3-methyl-5-hydroxy-6-metoxy-1,4-benzoquinol methylase